MNHYNSEGSSEGEWDGRSETDWNEFDWSRYLQNTEEDVGRFLKYYHHFIERADRVDAAASAMGWDAEDWAPDELEELEEDPFGDLDSSLGDSELEDFQNWEPYTLHRHPLYVSSRALISNLDASIEYSLEKKLATIEPLQLKGLIKLLSTAETECILAIQALELGDYSLVVCHFKRAVDCLNRLLGKFSDMQFKTPDQLDRWVAAMRIRLFDLRDIWLRVMRDCRIDPPRSL